MSDLEAPFACRHADTDNVCQTDLDTALDPEGALGGMWRLVPDMLESRCAVTARVVKERLGVDVPCGRLAELLVKDWAEGGNQAAVETLAAIDAEYEKAWPTRPLEEFADELGLDPSGGPDAA